MSFTRHIRFQEVSVHGEKSGKCVVCGKTCKLRHKFWATINPFNLNKARLPKTESEVRADLYIKRDKWMKEPFVHQKCIGER